MYEPFVSYKDRIDAGMSRLDMWKPDWYREINQNMLDISSPELCMCGQLSKFVDAGVPESVKGWRRTLKALGIDNAEAGEFGFVGTGFYDSYSELTREWRSAIKERLAFDAEVAALSDDVRSEDITTGHQVLALS